MARFVMARGQTFPGVQLGCDGIPGPAIHFSLRDIETDGALDIICSEGAAEWLKKRLVAPGLSADNLEIQDLVDAKDLST